MNVVQGSLVLIGVNTPTPIVLFNGEKVPGITGIRVDWEADEQRVKLKVAGDSPLYTALLSAGVHIKKEH